MFSITFFASSLYSYSILGLMLYLVLPWLFIISFLPYLHHTNIKCALCYIYFTLPLSQLHSILSHSNSYITSEKIRIAIVLFIFIICVGMFKTYLNIFICHFATHFASLICLSCYYFISK